MAIRGGASRLPGLGGLLVLLCAAVCPGWAHSRVSEPELQYLLANGFNSNELTLTAVPPTTFPAGSLRNLALDVALPPSYAGDTLERLNVANAGTATDPSDIALMQGWSDEGDGVFDPATDLWLGDFAFTGDRWELTGLTHLISAGGVRIFVSVDVAPSAFEGQTVQLGLPSLPDVGIGMASGNDGPVDQPVFNPFAQAIGTSGRVTLSASPLAPGPAHPGDQNVLLMDLVAANTYSVVRTLTDLTFTNLASSAGAPTQAQLDGEIDQLTLRSDDDDDGVLDDPATDPILGAASFLNGSADFSGLSWDLPSDGSRRLFLVGDVSLDAAADGDVLGASIDTGLDVVFADTTAVAANFPVDSGGRWTVDGAVAAQIGNVAVPVATLSANDGPVPALDVTVPANGYAIDTFSGIQVVNLGSAGVSDIAELHLYRDGGDGVFGGDDVSLGPLVWSTDRYVSALLTQVVSGTGMRLFVGVTVSSSPTDSATVRLSIPVGGITMSSNNDGPLDTPVVGQTTLLLTTSPLVSSLRIDPAMATIGNPVTAWMRVQNRGVETITGVAPSALTSIGPGVVNPSGGPTPPNVDLAPGAIDSFSWTYTAADTTWAQLSGNATGVGQVSSLIWGSPPSASNRLEIFIPAAELQLFPVANMPFSINRGQQDVVPLTLTFRNPTGPGTSDVALTGLRIRIEDGAGSGIIPSDLLTSVVVNEGSEIYLDKQALENSGDEVDLTLASPVRITSAEPVTIGLRLDISPTTLEPEFRVTIVDATWMSAEDGVDGRAVTVTLPNDSYPVRSGLGQLVAGAADLNVVGLATTTQSAGPGQTELPLLSLRLDNQSIDPLSSAIVVGSVTVSLRDTLGVGLPNPEAVFARLRVREGTRLLLDGSWQAGVSTMTLNLSPPLLVPVNSPLQLDVTGDIQLDATAASFIVRLEAQPTFDARDANTGDPVSVVYATSPIEGNLTYVEETPGVLMAAGTPSFPPTLTVGTQNMTAISTALRHPGPPTQGAIRVDEISVDCRDENRAALAPGNIIDQIRILRNGIEVGRQANIPSTGSTITIPLSGMLVFAGSTVDMNVVVDVDAGAPQTGLELLIEDVGLVAVDANLGGPVSVLPEPGGAFPMSSGLTQLQPPADELQVSMTSLMPAVLTPGAIELPAAAIQMRNASTSGIGSITIEGLTVRATDADGTTLPIGAAAAQVVAYRGAELWAASGTLGLVDSVAVLTVLQPIVLAVDEADQVDVRITYRTDVATESIRVGIGQADVQVLQPGGALFTVRVEPAPGSVFPMYTDVGNFGAAGFEDSYSNFPNPFAAGRQSTTFVYSLPSDGTVTLRVLSARGQVVRTLVNAESRGAGLHQADQWNGLNGRGTTVFNGIYIGELVVQFDDGTQERLLRKIAVVR